MFTNPAPPHMMIAALLTAALTQAAPSPAGAPPLSRRGVQPVAAAAPVQSPRPVRPREPEPPDYGLSAPLLEVDRFSDAAASRLRRSALSTLPGPNEPIDLDKAPFLVRVQAGGRQRFCYDLDDRPARLAV